MRLANKVAIVTGAASGIGRAIALRFAEEGAAVAVADRDEDGAREVVAAIEAQGSRGLAARTDVSDRAAVDALVEQTVRAFGGLDILVANAGIARSRKFLDLDPAAWERVLAVNLTGVYYSCQAGARAMRPRGRGRIVTIASINGLIGTAEQANYNASKGGVLALTRTMATELAQYRITVNAIAPGFIDTPLLRTLPPEARQRRLARVPLGRFGQPEEIAAAAVFLASDECGYITGHTLVIDGGMTTAGIWSGE